MAVLGPLHDEITDEQASELQKTKLEFENYGIGWLDWVLSEDWTHLSALFFVLTQAIKCDLTRLQIDLVDLLKIHNLNTAIINLSILQSGGIGSNSNFAR